MPNSEGEQGDARERPASSVLKSVSITAVD